MKNIIFTLATLISSASLADALKPLIGSEWASENPGKLPYEKCRLEVDSDVEFSLGYGSSLQGDPGATLICESQKLGLYFQLPVETGRFQKVGATLDWMSMGWDKFKVKGLSGKTVENLFGKYKGFNLGVGWLIGIDFKKLKQNGISLKSVKGTKAGFSVAKAWLEVKPRARLHFMEYYDPSVLVIGTQGSPVPPTDFDYFDFDFSGPYSLDMDALKPYEFVEIKSDKQK